MRLLYLASPYSDKDLVIERMRYHAAISAALLLIEKGYFVFSPIIHCHPIRMASMLPGDAKFWGGYNERMLSHCDALIILPIGTAWTRSKGVLKEIEWAQAAHKRIFYLVIDEIVEGLPPRDV